MRAMERGRKIASRGCCSQRKTSWEGSVLNPRGALMVWPESYSKRVAAGSAPSGSRNVAGNTSRGHKRIQVDRDPGDEERAADEHEPEERQRVDADQRQRLDDEPQNNQDARESQPPIQVFVPFVHLGSCHSFISPTC